MATTRIHEGFKVPGRGLVAAAIMSYFTDKVIKDDEDEIRISELTSLTSATYEQVIEELKFLETKNWLKIANGDWEEAGSLRIEGWQIIVGIDQMTLPRPSAPNPPNTSSPTLRREETNKDEVILGDKIWFGTVEYNGLQGEPQFALSISSAPKDDPGSAEIVLEDTLGDREAAWRHFDNFVSYQSRGMEMMQVWVAADGAKWKCQVEGNDDPNIDEDHEPIKFGLSILRTLPGEATSTLVVDEIFDSQVLAWQYVDDYLSTNVPNESPTIEPLAPEEAGVGNSDRSPTITESTMGVKWRYWNNMPDGNDHFELDLPDGTETVRIISEEILLDKRAIEEIVTDLLKERGITEPDPVAKK